MEIKLKNGKSIPFEEFIPFKRNLVKLNLNDNGKMNGEGVWACLSDKDITDYNKNIRDPDYVRVATLRNNALMFYPARSWGAYIPYKLNGSTRPICNVSLIEPEQKMLFSSQETQD